MSPREHDAVREARDALVIITAVTPVLAVMALLIGIATGETSGAFRWVVGSIWFFIAASSRWLATRSSH